MKKQKSPGEKERQTKLATRDQSRQAKTVSDETNVYFKRERERERERERGVRGKLKERERKTLNEKASERERARGTNGKIVWKKEKHQTTKRQAEKR